MNCTKVGPQADTPAIPRETLDEIEGWVLGELPPGDEHGAGHTLRVLANARAIHEKEGGRWDIVKVTALLHDVGRPVEMEARQRRAGGEVGVEVPNHAEVSAGKARVLLERLGLPRDTVELVTRGILAHSFSAGVVPETLEAKIVSDADKLDALGAIGVFRTISYQVRAGTGLDGVIDHFHAKLLRLHERMHTATGRALAKERTEFMEAWLERLLLEAGRNEDG
ncbi:MAG: HD domain-containing protein [Promethearchaeota archaeon]